MRCISQHTHKYCTELIATTTTTIVEPRPIRIIHIDALLPETLRITTPDVHHRLTIEDLLHVQSILPTTTHRIEVEDTKGGNANLSRQIAEVQRVSSFLIESRLSGEAVNRTDVVLHLENHEEHLHPAV